MGVESEIPGWDDVVSWFGYETSFHDGEVVSIDLRRDPEPSLLKIRAHRMTNKVDVDGFYVLDCHVIVTFTLSGIFKQSLDGWNHQNILFGLKILKVENGWLLVMDTSFGVEGTIGARDVRIALEPLEA